MEFITGLISGAFDYNTDNWPDQLKTNVSSLTSEEKYLASLLISLEQSHLFAGFEDLGINDEAKHQFFAQVKQLNETYPGGLTAYITNARKLLSSAKNGDNPLEGWVPEVPHGVTLEPATPEYVDFEKAGYAELGATGFVLVAGGLGERLGYNGIKIELPVETTTGRSYLELYAREILAIQQRYALPDVKLPLAIMTSDDTKDKTVALLERNDYFGLDREQVYILKQEKVPALLNNNADIALSGPYTIDAKPHGHGDVHSLLHTSGVISKWQYSGIRWVSFFQDTNGLSFTTLPAMLGVSVSLGLEVNSLAVPRYAKQAVGAITKLVYTTKEEEAGVLASVANALSFTTSSVQKEMTVNVEYNQLDPLLRATINPEGDVNDPITGKSPFPGNINQLLFRLDSYASNLYSSSGIMPEFVNPKYADAEKTTFKKPTRLECMMQDYPKILSGGAKVGFTTAPDWVCYSPCKNNTADAAVSVASGVPAGCAFTAESDQYFLFAELLRRIGADIPTAPKKTILGITASPGPRIVFSPEMAIFPGELKTQFPFPNMIHITAKSTLVVEGDVVVRSLRLDGALRLIAVPGTRIIVRAGGKRSTSNSGHELQEVKINSKDIDEVTKMRGYSIKIRGEKVVSTEGLAVSEENSNGEFVYNGFGLVSSANYTPEEETDDAPQQEGVLARRTYGGFFC